MNLRKISGKTLEEARTRARKKYGDRYVIVEASKRTQTGSAYITIALERRGAEPSRTEQQSHGAPSDSLFTPMLKQIDRLIESGTETLSTLKKISVPAATPSPESTAASGRKPAPASSSTPVTSLGVEPATAPSASSTATEKTASSTNSKSETGTFPGVSYIKSAPDSWKTDSQSTKNRYPEKQATDPDFRQYFRKKAIVSGKKTADDQQLKDLKKRLETLEKMVWAFTDNHSAYSEDPMYCYLRDQKFQPDFLMKWIENSPTGSDHAGEDSEVNRELLHQYLRERTESYFETKLPLSVSNKHLFTSFPGVNVTRLISALGNMCRINKQKFKVGIIFSDSFENDELSFQLMDSFKSINTDCRDIVTHRDWQNLSAATDPETLIFLVTHPMPYNSRDVESAWSHFNRVLGEYHAVKHHFIAHSLHNPSEIINMLPASHPFSPDYIDLINLEMSQSCYGRLTEYHEKAGFEFGFFHRACRSRTEPFGTIIKNLAPMVFRNFNRSTVPDTEENSVSTRV